MKWECEGGGRVKKRPRNGFGLKKVKEEGGGDLIDRGVSSWSIIKKTRDKEKSTDGGKPLGTECSKHRTHAWLAKRRVLKTRELYQLQPRGGTVYDRRKPRCFRIEKTREELPGDECNLFLRSTASKFRGKYCKGYLFT